MGSPRTLVVGESLVDVVHRDGLPASEHVGGSPLNVAVGLARLGHPAQLATWIGDDAFGVAVQEHLRADSVALAPGSVTAPRTPSATAYLDESGSARYEFDLAWDLPYPMPTGFGHFHTGSIAAALQPGAERVMQWMLTARHTATTSFDPNVRPTLLGAPARVRAPLEQLIGLADVVKASDEDIRWLYGQDVPLQVVLRQWSMLGPHLLVVTQGAAGALAYISATGAIERVAGHAVRVVDTVGAGDSFQSGLISGLLDAGLLGGPAARDRLAKAEPEALLAAVRRAVDASAITVSRAGAQPPTRAEL